MTFQNRIDGTALLRPEMTLSGSDAYRDSDLDANAMQNDFRMLLEAVSDYAVYRLTPEGNVSSWNKGAERNKGYTVAEAIGLHVSAFYTAEDRAAGAPARALAAAAGPSSNLMAGGSARTAAASGRMSSSKRSAIRTAGSSALRRSPAT